ncbi:MAG: dephospho-CoA kinase [Pseudohongiellaceae bacterium]
MFVVGLTGGIGSGKTTVADCFADLGINLVDADLLAREVVEPGSAALSAISEHFGHDILNPEGHLNRPKLRQIVFEDSSQKQWLEKLLHPAIQALMLVRLESSTSPYTILVSPLLLETDQYKLANRILVVDVPVEVQLSRTLQRDGSNEDTIKSIIKSQIDRDSRLARADDVVSNTAEPQTLVPRVLSLHEKYLNLSEAYQQS